MSTPVVTNFDEATKTLCIAVVCNEHEADRSFIQGPSFYEWRTCWSQMWGLIDVFDKTQRRPDLLKDHYRGLDWYAYWRRRIETFWVWPGKSWTGDAEFGIKDPCIPVAGANTGSKSSTSTAKGGVRRLPVL